MNSVATGSKAAHWPALEPIGEGETYCLARLRFLVHTAYAAGMVALQICCAPPRVFLRYSRNQKTRGCSETRKNSPYVIIQRASAFAVESESLPSAGAPCFLTVRYGFAWVTCVPLDNVIDSGHTIETIAAYVDTKTRTFFNKLPSFGLCAGSSIFLPLGYIPLIVGIGASSSDDEENTSKYEYVSVVVQPVLCEKNLPNISPAILSEIKGWFNKALSRATRIFNANEMLNKKAMEAWMADWPTKDNLAISPDHTKGRRRLTDIQIEDCGDVN